MILVRHKLHVGTEGTELRRKARGIGDPRGSQDAPAPQNGGWLAGSRLQPLEPLAGQLGHAHRQPGPPS